MQPHGLVSHILIGSTKNRPEYRSGAYIIYIMCAGVLVVLVIIFNHFEAALGGFLVEVSAALRRGEPCERAQFPAVGGCEGEGIYIRGARW